MFLPAHDEIGEAAKHAKVLLAQHQFRQNTELVGSHSISSLPISVLDVLVPVVGQYAARAPIIDKSAVSGKTVNLNNRKAILIRIRSVASYPVQVQER